MSAVFKPSTIRSLFDCSTHFVTVTGKGAYSQHFVYFVAYEIAQ